MLLRQLVAAPVVCNDRFFCRGDLCPSILVAILGGGADASTRSRSSSSDWTRLVAVTMRPDSRAASSLRSAIALVRDEISRSSSFSLASAFSRASIELLSKRSASSRRCWSSVSSARTVAARERSSSGDSRAGFPGGWTVSVRRPTGEVHQRSRSALPGLRDAARIP